MINKADVERIRLRYQLSSIYPDNHVNELCDYWLEQNKEKKIKKLTEDDKYYGDYKIVVIKHKLNEIIDVVNELNNGE